MALVDTELLNSAGFATYLTGKKQGQGNGLPIKRRSGLPNFKDAIKKQLRILDEQDAVNRYKWYNLPNGLNGQLLERILYYRGQGMFFYMKTNNTFYFLPYALDGNIDVYGRFTGVTPLPFNGPISDKQEKPWIEGKVLKPVYDVMQELNIDDLENNCVLLKDYTEQISQTNIPRQLLNDPVLDLMSEAFPLARTSLIANSGVRGLRVGDETEQANVEIANESIYDGAINGKPWTAIVGTQDFQDLTNGSALKSEEYLLYMQSIDNYRLSLYGLDNGGLFQKKSHMLESEQQMNAGTADLIYQDGLTIRQRFCDIVNSIWGIGIWCEASETVIGMDTNMDGVVLDNQDQSGIPGEQDSVEVDNEQ